jgi:hypothetical protein
MKVTVPSSFRANNKGAAIEVFTPQGLAVTLPRDATVIDGDSDTRVVSTVAVIRPGGTLKRGVISSLVLVEGGGSVGRSPGSAIYAQSGATVLAHTPSCRIHHAPDASLSGISAGPNVNSVPAIFPSYVDALFNSRR